jgi:peptide/nickel transport system substrate-binding protein
MRHNFSSRIRKAAVCLLLFSAGAHAAPARPKYPAVLRVCDDIVDPVTLDPRRQFSEKNYTIIRQIFDGLVRFDPDGRIEPALAVSWTRIDPLTVEFKLREGVRFHDGEVFDAEAVRFTLESLIDPKTAFPGAGFLNSIDRVEVAGPLTIRIRTKFPDGILLNRLAALVVILPPRRIARDGDDAFAVHPVGTGAFRFKRWEKGKAIVLEENPDYWAGRPGFSGLEFLFLSTSRQVAGLLHGDVDIVTELPGTETLKVMQSQAAKIVKKESFYTVGASVNISSGPMSDKRVRQAINYAIDKDALVRYDVLGNARPLASLTMPGEIGHNPDLKTYPYDPQKARQLLRDAGYPNGLALKVIVKAQGERTMRIISSQLERVGIRVETEMTTDASVIQDIQKQRWDFTFGGCPDSLAHSFFIQFIFLSALSPYSIHRNETFDRMLAKMVATLDEHEQDRVGRELDRYVHDEALGIFTYQRIKTFGVSKRINFVASITGMPDFYRSYPNEENAR